jgi:predicted small secreted protein
VIHINILAAVFHATSACNTQANGAGQEVEPEHPVVLRSASEDEEADEDEEAAHAAEGGARGSTRA